MTIFGKRGKGVTIERQWEDCYHPLIKQVGYERALCSNIASAWRWVGSRRCAMERGDLYVDSSKARPAHLRYRANEIEHDLLQLLRIPHGCLDPKHQKALFLLFLA